MREFSVERMIAKFQLDSVKVLRVNIYQVGKEKGVYCNGPYI